MDTGEIPFNMYIDLSKAFDTLDHSILVKKLDYYGVKDTALDLCRDDLENRKQYVQIDTYKSDTTTITTGVPQGSILGPLLFIIYLNDISKFSTLFNTITYADDTTLMGNLSKFKSNGERDLSGNINYELTKLSDWLKVNRLSLNAKKTKLMIFRTFQKNVIIPKIEMDEIELDPVSNFNYLGIIINENVKWKNHLNKIACNISKKVGIIFKLSHFISCYILLSIYNSLILPHITYGILAWGYESDIIFGLQKKAVRAMTCAKYTAHTGPIFQKLNLLKLKDIHKIQQLKFYYKLKQNHLPEYFNTILTLKACDVHNHLTRNRSDFFKNRVNHTFAEKCIRYYLLKTVDSVPASIRLKINTHSLQGFLGYCKSNFISKYAGICQIKFFYVCNH